MSKYGYLDVFQESLGARDNESRLYFLGEASHSVLILPASHSGTTSKSKCSLLETLETLEKIHF